MSTPVYIIDSMNYIFRAYHALPDSITAPSGMGTNAVLGYLRMLLRLIREHKPEYIAAVFEGETSFRHAIYAAYKANRQAMPEDLSPQIEYCRKLTKAMGVACLELEDYEADDVIGTAAARMAALGHRVAIVTGDKDMAQLVGDNIRIYDLAKELWLDESGVREKFGVWPRQIPDLLALYGDHVDNIPGVPGVGEKTARRILSLFESIEELAGSANAPGTAAFRGRDEILRRVRDNIATVRVSRKLATICCEAPIQVTAGLLRYRRGDRRLLDPLCTELGFRKVLEDIPLAQPALF